jgi:hypothetical protein
MKLGRFECSLDKPGPGAAATAYLQRTGKTSGPAGSCHPVDLDALLKHTHRRIYGKAFTPVELGGSFFGCYQLASIHIASCYPRLWVVCPGNLNPKVEYLNPKEIPGTRLRVIKYSKLKEGVRPRFGFWSFDIV